MTKFRVKYKNPSLSNLTLVRNVELKASTPEEARGELQAGAGGEGKHNYLLNDIRNVLQIEKIDLE